MILDLLSKGWGPLLIFNFSFTLSAHAQRYALVIGNSNYLQLGALANPINYATDMGRLLEQKDFKVTVLKNANKRQMQEGINNFARLLHQKDAVGLFYFAGHGMQIDGINYLIPVQSNINTETDVEYEAVDARRVLAGMRRVGNGLNMVILDACRDNPFDRSFRGSSRGLARMDTAKGALILYAASAGEVAADGEGRNGLFTSNLMKAINTPGLKVEDVFKKKVIDVTKATNDKQWPWSSGSIKGNFYFTINAPKAKTVTIQVPPSSDKQAEILFWESIKNKTNPAYFKRYLEKYPKGIYAELARLEIDSNSPVTVVGTLENPIESNAHLTIKTDPNNARVRILNIGPKYQAGMALKPGRYHIEVTETGYQRHLKWLELGQQDTVVSVELDKQQQVATIAPQQAVETKVSARFTSARFTDMKFVYVNPGCFQMGSNSNYGGRDEKPVHRVCLTQDYYLGKYEVTQAQWQQVMGNNPAYYKGSNKPVENVVWDDVQDFIRKLNQQTGLHYRLPTEAEWEYACRSGGEDQKYCGGNNANSVAWYDDRSGSGPRPVGQKQANGLGLYDISGNVWEWVQDRYDGDYYSNSSTTVRLRNKG